MFKSIRVKLSLALLALFVPFYIILFHSNFLFFRDDYRYVMVERQRSYENIVSSLAKKASVITDEKSIEALLDANTNKDMQIQLLNTKGDILWSKGEVPSNVRLTAKAYIVTNGEIRYGLRIYGVFDIQGAVYKKYVSDYRWMILPLLGLLFILIALFIHITIIKPIFSLYKRMEGNPMKLVIGEKNYCNDEIGVLEKQFDGMVKNLQTADRQQQTMLADISHDIKTPLTSILTYTDRLSSGKVTNEEKQQHYYDVIKEKAEDIRQLIDKFQEASKFADFDIKATYEILPAAEFWQSVFEPYTEEWGDVDAKLEYVCKIENSAVFCGDKSSLIRVVANLMNNAVKYGAHPLLVHVKLTQRENQLVLKLENNGLQVPEDKLPLLFDRFYRVESSRSREGGGSGLGLFICSTIIEKHGGFIRAYKPLENDFGIEIILPLVKS